MAQCVTATLEPDGSIRLVPDTQSDLQQCSFVLQTGAEVGNSLAFFSPAQGLEISMYAAGLWALAWGFKQVAKVIDEVGNEKIDE